VQLKAVYTSFARELCIAVVGGAVLYGIVLGVNEVNNLRKEAGIAAPVQIGGMISLPQITMPSTPKILLIATSASCQFSKTNLAFHQRLVAAAAQAGIPTIAVVPDAASATMARDSLSLPSGQIVMTNMRKLGIQGTPAIAVLDSNKQIEHLWKGSLPGYLEEAVFSQVLESYHIISYPDTSQLTVVSDKGRNTIQNDASGRIVEKLNTAELHARLAGVNLVDISPREVFARIGKPGSTNIPYDEISVRAHYEMDPTAQWLVDCSQVDPGNCDMATYSLREKYSRMLVLDRGASGASCLTTPTL
jgi:hypothetical protein